MALYLNCESVAIFTITVESPAVKPGAVIVCTETVVVELPIITYTVVQHWPDPQDIALFNTFVFVSDFRGPPAQTLISLSCQGARSCAPQIVSSIPRGGYAH